MAVILTGGRLVKNDGIRAERNDGGDGDALFLAVADRVDRPVAHLEDAAGFHGVFRAPEDLFLRELPQPQRHLDLVFDDVVDKHLVWDLHNIANALADLPNGHFPVVRAVDVDGSALRAVDSGDEAGKGGFPGAVLADDGNAFSLPDGQGEPFENISPGLVGIGYALEPDGFPARLFQPLPGLPEKEGLEFPPVAVGEFQMLDIAEGGIMKNVAAGIFHRGEIEWLPDAVFLQ